MIPRIFEGGSVAIVAGGPSLTGFDFAALALCNVIAINRAYEFLPGATVLWWSDAMFYRNHKDRLHAHAAPYKASGQLNYQKDELGAEIHQYQFTGRDGFDPDPGNLRHGNNSAFSAMHLAVHLGARRLVLFGVDMQHGPKGETHFHGGHGLTHDALVLKQHMLPFFASLKKPFDRLGIDVWNANPDSALRVWPLCTRDHGVRLVEPPFQM